MRNNGQGSPKGLLGKLILKTNMNVSVIMYMAGILEASLGYQQIVQLVS